MIYLIIGGVILISAFSITESEASLRKQMSKWPEWRKWDRDFQHEAAKNGIDWKWLKAIALNESLLGREKSVKHGFANPGDVEASKSSDGLSWGLMQITLKTGRHYDPNITPQRLNDPYYSIRIAAQIVRDEQAAFPGDLEFIIKSYNQGAGNSRRERAGKSKGFTGEYWPKFLRNLARVEAIK